MKQPGPRGEFRFVLFAAGVLIGGGLGVWWGRSHPRAAEAAALASPHPTAPIEDAAAPEPRGRLSSSPAPSTIMASAATPTDYLARLLELAGKPRSETQRQEMAALLIAWTQADPAAAYGYAVTRTSRPEREFALNTVLKEWAKHDPNRVLAQINDLTTRIGLVNAWRMVVDATAAVAPAETLAALQRLPPGRLQADLIPTLVHRWGTKEPLRALAWARALHPGDVQERSLAALFEGWAERDPRAAAPQALALPPGEARQQALAKVAASFSALDPKGALAWFQSMSPGREQEQAWRAMVERGLPRYLENFSGASIVAEAQALLGMGWNNDQRRQLQQVVARQLVVQDPAAAQAWVTQLPEGRERAAALQAMVDSWSQNDPGRALGFALDHASAFEHDSLAELAGHWGRFDPTAALQFARDLPAGDTRLSVMLGLVEGLRDTNPAQAASLINDLPAGETRAQAASYLARAWTFNDPAGTVQWMNALPPGGERDAAISSFVMSMDGYDIALANQWAAAIEEPTQRIRVAGAAFDRWLREDQAQARQWLEGTTLDAALRAHLEGLVQRRGNSP